MVAGLTLFHVYVLGGNGLLNSTLAKHLADPTLTASTLSRLVDLGFAHAPDPAAFVTSDPTRIKPFEISRESYASMFGPTKGDRLRLADTELWIEIEEDMTVYGDECKFGGGEAQLVRPVGRVGLLGLTRNNG